MTWQIEFCTLANVNSTGGPLPSKERHLGHYHTKLWSLTLHALTEWLCTHLYLFHTPSLTCYCSWNDYTCFKTKSKCLSSPSGWDGHGQFHSIWYVPLLLFCTMVLYVFACISSRHGVLNYFCAIDPLASGEAYGTLPRVFLKA